MCFFAGGVKYAEQTVKSTAAQLNSSLLLIAVIAVLIPSAFHFSITTTPTGEGLSLTNAEEGNDLLAMSHGVAILLLLLYIGYLLFQMWTHAVSLRQSLSWGSAIKVYRVHEQGRGQAVEGKGFDARGGLIMINETHVLTISTFTSMKRPSRAVTPSKSPMFARRCSSASECITTAGGESRMRRRRLRPLPMGQTDRTGQLWVTRMLSELSR